MTGPAGGVLLSATFCAALHPDFGCNGQDFACVWVLDRPSEFIGQFRGTVSRDMPTGLAGAVYWNWWRASLPSRWFGAGEPEGGLTWPERK